MDTTRHAGIADEVSDPAAAAAQASRAAKDRPYAINEARDVANDMRKRWELARCPTRSEWISFGMTLSVVERSLAAIRGLAQLSADHEFARYSSDEYAVPLHSISGFQAGCVRDAQELLAHMAGDALDALRTRYTRE